MVKLDYSVLQGLVDAAGGERCGLVSTKRLLWDKGAMKAFASEYWDGLRSWSDVHVEMFRKKVEVLTAVVEMALGRGIDADGDRGRVLLLTRPGEHDTEWLMLDGMLLGSLKMVWSPTLQEQMSGMNTEMKCTVRFEFTFADERS